MLLVAAAAFAACGNNPRKTVADRQQDDCVEVLCFYGAKRCATCIAIETGVKEVVETDFAGQVGAGEVYFRIIDIVKPENEALADRYEVTWSALLLNKWRDGKGSVFVGKEKRRKEQVSSSQIFDSLFCICSEQ